METTFFLNTNFSDEDSRLIFFDDFIKYFFDEVDNYCCDTARKQEEFHIAEYGEMTMVNFFINGIARNDDLNRYIILNEFGIDKIEGDKTGRADIIIEDTLVYEVYYIEAKKVSSNEDAPKSDCWKEEELEKYYQQILGQANKYLEADIEKFKDDSRMTPYKIALVFDSVTFEDKSKVKDWFFEGLKENEFYAFKTYEHNNKTIGLACYGIIEKYMS